MKTVIKKFIEMHIPDLKGKIYPVFTVDLKNISVVYTVTPLSGGHLKESQLELKVIHSDYDVCVEYETKLLDLLDMEEDEPFVNTGAIRFHSELSGGGILFNDGCQMFEDTLYFLIKWRDLHEKQR